MTDSPISHPLPHPPSAVSSSSSRSNPASQGLYKQPLTYRAVTYPQIIHPKQNPLSHKSRSATTSKLVSRTRSAKDIHSSSASSSRTHNSYKYGTQEHLESEDTSMVVMAGSSPTIGVT